MFNKSEIISLLLPYAKMLYEKYNLLPSVTMAQAILETGWLRHCAGNNVFGIKWIRNSGYDFQEIHTHEWIDGVKTPKICLFRKYKDYTQSFHDYGRLLTTLKRYEPVVSAEYYESACNELYRCGYCTDPQYPKKLISIIEDNNLDHYDPIIDDSKKAEEDPLLILQKNLNKLQITDYEKKPLAEDGIIGPRTRSSINLFKKMCKITRDIDIEETLKLTRIILNYNTFPIIDREY